VIMAHSSKRIIGSEATKVGPALHVSYFRRRKTVRGWFWLLLAPVIVASGAWIDAMTEVPVCGAIFLFVGWRLWRAA